MPRTLTTAIKAALTAQTGEVVLLFQLGFSGGTLHLTNGAVPITWGGNVYTALGGLLSYDGLAESGDLSASGLTISASGVDQTIIAALLNEGYIGQTVSVWRAYLDPTTFQPIADPVPLFTGYMNGGWSVEEDYPDPSQGSGTCTIRLTCTDRLAQLDQKRGIQGNLGSHQSLYPSDQFFRYSGAAIGQNMIWQNS